MLRAAESVKGKWQKQACQSGKILADRDLGVLDHGKFQIILSSQLCLRWPRLF